MNFLNTTRIENADLGELIQNQLENKLRKIFNVKQTKPPGKSKSVREAIISVYVKIYGGNIIFFSQYSCVNINI